MPPKERAPDKRVADGLGRRAVVRGDGVHRLPRFAGDAAQNHLQQVGRDHAARKPGLVLARPRRVVDLVVGQAEALVCGVCQVGREGVREVVGPADVRDAGDGLWVVVEAGEVQAGRAVRNAVLARLRKVRLLAPVGRVVVDRLRAGDPRRFEVFEREGVEGARRQCAAPARLRYQLGQVGHAVLEVPPGLGVLSRVVERQEALIACRNEGEQHAQAGSHFVGKGLRVDAAQRFDHVHDVPHPRSFPLGAPGCASKKRRTKTNASWIGVGVKSRYTLPLAFLSSGPYLNVWKR